MIFKFKEKIVIHRFNWDCVN